MDHRDRRPTRSTAPHRLTQLRDGDKTGVTPHPLAGVPIQERMRAALEILRADPRVDRWESFAAVVSAPVPVQPLCDPAARHDTQLGGAQAVNRPAGIACI
jgi:hypothetical protein